MVKSPKTIYESSFFVLKRNICSVVAMFGFLISAALCCVCFVCMLSAFLGNPIWSNGWISLELGDDWYLFLILGLLLLLTAAPLELGLKRWYYQLTCLRKKRRALAGTVLFYRMETVWESALVSVSTDFEKAFYLSGGAVSGNIVEAVSE